MSDGSIGMQALLSYLRPDDSSLWSIVRELADTSEEERGRLLRPHLEAGFTWKSDPELMARRNRLDEVLNALTTLEVGCQLGLVTSPLEMAPELSGLQLLFRESAAFTRYANAFLYFGIRFLAGRIAPPSWLACSPGPELLLPTANQRLFALVPPPPLPASAATETNFAKWLNLPSGGDIVEALLFLDDPVGLDWDPLGDDRKEPQRFELWLQGLQPEIDSTVEKIRCETLVRGLTAWAITRSEFYLSLEPPSAAPPAAMQGGLKGIEGEVKLRPRGGWRVGNPVAARLGLRDLYWIARVLRADVSAEATVRYGHTSWLGLLQFHAGLGGNPTQKLRKAEEVLRSVFDFVCDLVQNGVELSEEKEREYYESDLLPPAKKIKGTPKQQPTAKWREVFDEELEEIDLERGRRNHHDSSRSQKGSPPSGGSPPVGNRADGWMERIKGGRQPHILIGLAFSGGGIRSATFNLGILQGLQELDLLRHVDFLSTVSGGGFIGSWLVGNVARTKHWLGRLTSWEESISHLRRYSNYLAPLTGILSADTWTMWASWARNALLIQVTGLVWLFFALLIALVAHSAFVVVGKSPGTILGLVQVPGAVAGLAALVVLLTLLYNLKGRRPLSGREKAFDAASVQYTAVIPAWIGAFLVASLLWADATGQSAAAPAFANVNTYSGLLAAGLQPWPWRILLIIVALALFFIARTTLSRHRWYALLISPLCTLTLYLQLCGIMRAFIAWKTDQFHFGWYAFVLGPSLVLAANTLSVVLFIGFCGRYSNESVREWWTRFGSWLAMYGAGSLAVATAAVFGPLWILSLAQSSLWHGTIKWSAVVGWIATTIGGLLAGKSSRTKGTPSPGSSKLLETLAKIGGLVFIVGAVLGVSTLLYILLVNIGTDCGDLKHYWETLPEIPTWLMGVGLAVTLLCGLLFSWFFEINIFGLNQFYRSRLVRCYLGATRWSPGLRKPQPFTQFDHFDDMRLSAVTRDYRSGLPTDYQGPFPIFNCSLNLGGSADLALHTRHSASFSLTPLRCGADRVRVGYARTRADDGSQEFAGGVMLGQAVAVSGAAASPNMGYNTSPLVAFLLTMFNVRLGWWFPNPGRRFWDHPGLRFSLLYLVQELFGLADETKPFVNVSDGGHFENLGIYELVRRRCKVIIACDAECDEFLQFGSLGNVVRICETDFGAKIDINVNSIRQQKDGFSLTHCTVGKITYSNGSIGYLIYLKASVSSDEEVGISQYRSVHPSFPHETTADQFFSEDQFESYRQLGLHVVRHSLRGAQPGDHPMDIAEKMYDVLAPAGAASEIFVKHATALDDIWEKFRQSPSLRSFMQELMSGAVTTTVTAPQHEEICIGLELIQLMENVFLDLRLDDFWEHPDVRGWAILFMRWARSPRFRAIWNLTRRTFGIRFEYFCAARLGLPRDEPIVRA